MKISTYCVYLASNLPPSPGTWFRRQAFNPPVLPRHLALPGLQKWWLEPFYSWQSCLGEPWEAMEVCPRLRAGQRLQILHITPTSRTPPARSLVGQDTGARLRPSRWGALTRLRLLAGDILPCLRLPTEDTLLRMHPTMGDTLLCLLNRDTVHTHTHIRRQHSLPHLLVLIQVYRLESL